MFLQRYSHYGFMWKKGRKTPTWKKRIFALQQNVLSYWEPTKETSPLVDYYTKALKASDLKVRDDLKIQLKSALLIKNRISYLILDKSTEIDIPQNSTRHFPTTNKVPTSLSFEVVVTEPSPRRLLCCTEEKSSRQLWLDLIKTRTRSSLYRVVEQIIDPKIRFAMQQNKIKHKKIESIMDPTARVICDAPQPTLRIRQPCLKSVIKRNRSLTNDLKTKPIHMHKRPPRLRSHRTSERRFIRPESLPQPGLRPPKTDIVILPEKRRSYII